MELNLKNFDKAIKLLKQIKKLDAEIIELEAVAVSAANKELQTSVRFSITDIAKKKEAEDKVTIGHDGDLVFVTGRHFNMFDGLMASMKGFQNEISQKEDAYKKKLEAEISESTLLKIISILLSDKKERRLEHLSQLQKFGISI